METDGDTNIQKFYKNKKIFLTGGTGFLGKAYIEKALRVTDVGQIYILIRPKKGHDIKARLKTIFADPLFVKLHSSKPNLQDYVTPISGDCSMPNLGLSDTDRAILEDNVDIIVHSAATVRFNEPLGYAVDVNVRATVDIINLAKNMKSLKAFVHVSSAFSNCFESFIEERYYAHKIGVKSEDICKTSNTVGSEKLNSLTNEICKKFPNTYCFTKALAEEAILTKGSGLPICIFRPAIVTSIYEDPLPGWNDNMNGVTSLMYGYCYGIVRTFYGELDYVANIVPVDFCANMMMVCAWKVDKLATTDIKKCIPPPIYNLVQSADNSLLWRRHNDFLRSLYPTMPLKQMLWYPMYFETQSKLLYKFYCLVLHTIPAFIIDCIATLTGRERGMMSLYKKVHTGSELLHYFAERQWKFSMENTVNLWTSLSPKEQQVFNFDMSSISWEKFLCSCLSGMRLYIAKENPSTIPTALKKYQKLKSINKITMVGIFGSLSLFLLWCLIKIFF